MSTKRQELVQSLNSVELVNKLNSSEQQKEEELVKRHPILGTPFVVIQQEGKTVITFGKYRMNDSEVELKSVDEAVLWAEQNFGMLIYRMVLIIVNDRLNDTEN